MPLIHQVLVLSVVPGEGGQAFIPESVNKIKELKKYIDENNLDVDIEVDGGINPETAELAREAGADILVSGAYILNSGDAKDAIRKLKGVV